MAIILLPLITSILKKPPKQHISFVSVVGRIDSRSHIIFRPKRFSSATSAAHTSSSVSSTTEQENQKPSSLSPPVLTFQQAIQRLQACSYLITLCVFLVYFSLICGFDFSGFFLNLLNSSPWWSIHGHALQFVVYTLCGFFLDMI